MRPRVSNVAGVGRMERSGMESVDDLVRGHHVQETQDERVLV